MVASDGNGYQWGRTIMSDTNPADSAHQANEVHEAHEVPEIPEVHEEEMLDEAERESFPASDAPSSWAGRDPGPKDDAR
jgi:hypothetical protein